jgi:CxxC motif-containing protein (DUF1111 family)
MRALRVFGAGLFAAALALPLAFTSNNNSGSNRTEAPAGFDNLTNGFLTQEEFEFAKEVFEEIEFVEDGLGPVYNAEACASCHQTPVTGGVSQVTELRAGNYDGRNFREHAGGSLINDRAIDADLQERIQGNNNVRTLRSSLNVLGDGFVEAIDSRTLSDIASRQPRSMRGTVIQVPVNEAGGSLRVGRFGWKNQHASLESFSADAYKNEMGITSPLEPVENTSNGRSVAAYDTVPDPEDDGADIVIFANFMRSTKVPPRDTALAATSDAREGSRIFSQIGCDNCHVRDIVTAPAGTSINGGAFVVPAALGDKIIHPFGDFLLHDVGTGDGIVQNGGGNTRNKMRTAPLWGVRTRSRLLHDGSALTFNDAILAHGGEASSVTSAYRNLSSRSRSQLQTFLSSL